MSIYHLTVKIGSKDQGHSAGQKCAYITRTENYAKKADECAYSASGNMPNWAKTNPQKDPSEYWKAADIYERDNGRLYREVEFALPRELSLEQQKTLCHAFAERLSTLDKSEKLPFTFAIHTDKENHNPHCHLMISERVNDGISRNASTWFKRANPKEPKKGGATKTQELKGKQWLEPTRQLWADLANEALRQNNPEFNLRIDGIDHRSNKARGIDALPSQHLGKACADMLRRGAHCHRGQEVTAHNRKVEVCNSHMRHYPTPRSKIGRMVCKGFRGISARYFGAFRKDGRPKTFKEILRDLDRLISDILRSNREMAEDQARLAQLKLENFYAESQAQQHAHAAAMSAFYTAYDFGQGLKLPEPAKTANPERSPQTLPPARAYRYALYSDLATQEMPLLHTAFHSCVMDDKAKAYDVTLHLLQKLPTDHPIRTAANGALQTLLDLTPESPSEKYTRYDVVAKSFGQWFIQTHQDYQQAEIAHIQALQAHQAETLSPAKKAAQSPFYRQWKYVPRFARPPTWIQ